MFCQFQDVVVDRPNAIMYLVTLHYFRRAIYLPFLDMMIQQLNLRFSSFAGHVTQALRLVPSGIDSVGSETIGEILEYFKEDLPSSSSFTQEFQLLKALWQRQTEKLNDISSTLSDPRCCSLIGISKYHKNTAHTNICYI